MRCRRLAACIMLIKRQTRSPVSVQTVAAAPFSGLPRSVNWFVGARNYPRYACRLQRDRRSIAGEPEKYHTKLNEYDRMRTDIFTIGNKNIKKQNKC